MPVAHSTHLTLPQLTSFHLTWIHCDWSQPQWTGLLYSTWPSLLCLWLIMVHSVQMKWGQIR